MPFSPGQQPEYRRLRKAAWARVCKLAALEAGEGSAVDARDKAAERAWFEREMEIATGQRSSKDCNASDDYDEAMAHFEELAQDGIHWQARRAGGNERRLDFTLRRLGKSYSAEYLNALALRLCRQPLAELTVQGRIKLIAALKIDARRGAKRGENEPF